MFLDTHDQGARGAGWSATRRPVARTVGGALVVALLLAGCGDDGGEATEDEAPAGGTSGAAATTGGGDAPVIDPGDGGNYDPRIDPADFVERIDNPYLPLVPGASWTYEGTTDEGTERTEVVVTDRHREVMGVTATVVRDTVELDGELVEDTYDWFAQDARGNVWYLGEESKEYEDGEVASTEGSWEAGVDGALPGIVMPADPQVGDAYRQEYYEGEAEDVAEVVRVGAVREVPVGTFDDVLVTEEWNPLEPDVVEEKYYAPGVGMVAEAKVEGGDERAELVEHTPGS